MSDAITIRKIRAYGRHGVPEIERDSAQPFDIDIELQLDLTAAGVSDDLGDTLDYALIHRYVIQIVASTSFRLLEKLGERIVAELLSDPRVSKVNIALEKPGLLAGATPGVRLTRARPAV